MKNNRNKEQTKNTFYCSLYLIGFGGFMQAVIYGMVYYYVKDMLGNIIEIRRVNDNSLVAFYEYDAWGNHKVCNSDGSENNDPNFIGNLNPFRYRGYYYDTDVKMYYLQTRWYDPEIGRFVNMDQIEYLDPETANGLNLYAYCGNNPVMGYDPTGTFGFIATLIFSIVAGALIKGGMNAVKQLAENDFDKEKIKENFDWNEVWAEAIEGAAEGFAFGAGGGLLATMAGTVSVSLTTAKIVAGISVVANFAAGMGSYVLHNSGNELNHFLMIESGIYQGGKAIINIFEGGFFYSISDHIRGTDGRAENGSNRILLQGVFEFHSRKKIPKVFRKRKERAIERLRSNFFSAG